jgi:septum site-determining protein MinD
LRSICVISGKGGVGKTTSAVSLAHAMGKHRKTLLVDANLTTPNVNVHLGWPILKKTLMEVLKGEASLSEAIYTHESGLRILPTVSSMHDLSKLKYEKLKYLMDDLKEHADIVLMDGAAGLGKEALGAMEACDEVLIITNPEMPAVMDAQKTVQLAQEMGKTILGVVLTKVRGKDDEMNVSDVESMLDLPVIGIIPFDKAVQKAQKAKHPVTYSHPKSKAGKSYEELAKALLGSRYFDSINKRSKSLFDYILRKLGLL